MTNPMVEPDPTPEPDLDFELRDLRAWIVSADPDDPECTDLVMIATDGDVTIRFGTGVGGPLLAKLGAGRLADVARQFETALDREPKPFHGPWTGP